jgi:hypothetical protein
MMRIALLCYPRWWREARGEEVTGLLMDSAEAKGRRSPSPADLVNLAVHGLRLRIGTSITQPSRPVRNRISVVALALLTAVCTTLLIFGEWAPWDPQTSMQSAPIANVTTGSFCYLAGILAALAVALGRPTSGRRLAVCCGLIAVAVIWAPVGQFAQSFGLTRPPGTVLVFVAVLSVLASIGDPLPPRGSRGLFTLLAATPTVGAVLVTALSLGPEPWFYYRHPDQTALRISGGILLGIGLTVIAVVLLAGGRRVWSSALAVNAVPWLLLFVLDPLLANISYWPMGGAGLLAAVILTGLLIGLTAVFLSRRPQPSRSSLASSE